MNWSKVLTIYGVHCEGEVGRVITSGVLNLPGATMLDKLNYINQKDDFIRTFTINEPRGNAQMCVNIVLPPVNPSSDAAFIVLQPDQAHAMSGSNAMCITTCLLETGILKMQEPVTRLTYDTAAGTISVRANCDQGKVTSVQIEMCPSFVEALNQKIVVDGLGEMIIDIGYGGCYYALCDVNQVGLKIRPADARLLVDKAYLIKEAIDRQITVCHPEIAQFNRVEYVMFTDLNEKEKNVYQNATIIYPGRVDRSPCGTGSAARMAVMHAKGQIKEGETIYMESIIGGRFKAEATKPSSMSDGRPCITPKFEGRSWIFSFEQLGLDPSDPLPLGYTLSDTWGPSAK